MKVFIFLSLIAVASATVYLQDKFDVDPKTSGWEASSWKSGESAEFEWTAGDWPTDDAAEKGIMTSTDMRFHAISKKLDTPVPAHVLGKASEDLVIQFSVKNQHREYAFCGGGYIKLLPKMDAASFGGDTEYAVMFGPDMCGYDVSRIHTIFTDKAGQNQLRTEDIKLEYGDKNEFTHVYTLHLKKDGAYEVFFDQVSKATGKIENDWAFEKKMIPDPEDKKPADWVDEKKIADPEEEKPEGYDDIPEFIKDPEAEKPEDWVDEDDGEWEAPEIKNPEFKGEWKPTMIDNPDYKGEWKPKDIENDKYDPELVTFPVLEHVGFELWTVNNGSIFDNIYIGTSLDEAKELAMSTWGALKDKEKDTKDAWKKSQEPPADDKADEEDDDDEAEDEAEDGGEKKEL